MALDAYMKIPVRDGVWMELQAFEEIHYSEQFYGGMDFGVEVIRSRRG